MKRAMKSRRRPVLAGLCLATLLLGACTTRGPRTEPGTQAPPLADSQARQMIATWQHRLADYIGSAGHGVSLTRSGGRLSDCRVSGARGKTGWGRSMLRGIARLFGGSR